MLNGINFGILFNQGYIHSTTEVFQNHSVNDKGGAGKCSAI